MAFLSKLSANLVLNTTGFRNSLSQSTQDVKNFQREASRALTAVAGKTSQGMQGGLSQTNRFNVAYGRYMAGGGDPNVGARAIGRQMSGNAGDRLQGLAGRAEALPSNIQAGMMGQYKMAAEAVTRLNTELMQTGRVSQSTFLQAKGSLMVFAAAVKKGEMAVEQLAAEQDTLAAKFSKSNNLEFFKANSLQQAESKLTAFRGIIASVGGETDDIAAGMQRLALLYDKANSKGAQGWQQMAGKIKTAESALAGYIAAQGKATGMPGISQGGVLSQVQAAGGKGGFNPNFGKAQMALQQLAFAVEDAAVSFETGGFNGALRGAGNNLTTMAMALGGVKTQFIVIGTIIGLQLIKPLARWVSGMKGIDEQQEKMMATYQAARKAREDEIKQIIFETKQREAAAERIANAFNAAAGTMQDFARTAGMTSQESSAANARNDARGLQRALIDNMLGNVQGFGTGSGSSWDMARQRVSAYQQQLEAANDPGQQTLLRRRLEEEQEGMDRIRQQTLERLSRRDLAGYSSSFFENYAELQGLSGRLSAVRERSPDVANTLSRGISDLTSRILRESSTGAMDTGAFRQLSIEMASLTERVKGTIATFEEFEESEKERVRLAEEQAREDKANLDNYRRATGMDLEERMLSFIRGGSLAGATAQEIANATRQQFGITAMQQQELSLASRGTIGASDLRSAAGGAELSRLLSGSDSNRTLVSVNQKQLDEQQKASALLRQLIAVQPALAGAV